MGDRSSIVTCGCVAAFWLLLTVPGVAAADREAEREAIDLLERMLQSMRTLSYSGTFVYLHGNQLESLKITHSLQEGQELERLVSLNGSAREVHRDQRTVTCVMPDARAVSIDRRAPGAGLWPKLDPDLRRLRGHYRLHLLGEFRVAGRAARVVGIIPKDKFRYGYRFYLDAESGLPLKTDLMSEEAEPVEQIMFTSLELVSVNALLHDNPAQQDGFRKSLRKPPRIRAPDQPSDWEFQRLPAGFGLQLQDHWTDEAGSRVEHFLLSDGLASVSVYVEKGSEEGLQGGAHVGAVNAWGGTVAAHQVTAVGEVPANTVRKVVESLRYRGEGGGE